ncbi:hypothetical protein [Paenibacillus albidus]|uniref:hypothetical protein n=1 Tax=Paenibacillus albidus TaxID=2041023 RepID=UPI001BE6FE6F|nr:hypothetical protein [Paenibacillus albidus]
MYTAEHSHSAYIARLMSSRPVERLTAELAFELEEKLHQTWSPEQIAGDQVCESPC